MNCDRCGADALLSDRQLCATCELAPTEEPTRVEGRRTAPPARASILDLAPGMHRGIAPATYYEKIPGIVSKSLLDLVHRSPMHARAFLDGGFEEESPALDFGSAFHMAALEPDAYVRTYVVAPDFGDLRTKAAKATREAWRKENVGKREIDADDAKTIEAMVAALRAHAGAAALLDEGDAELTVRWRDGESGLEAKARLDFFSEEMALVIDLKTTEDASAAAFARSCARYRYHVQSGLYLDGVRAAGGPSELRFVFIAIEKRAPHAVALYELDEDALRKGRFEAREDIATLAQCLEADDWPGFPDHVQTISLPAWA